MADRAHRHLFGGGALFVDPDAPAWDAEHPERNRPAARFMALADEVELALVAESARWGDQHAATPYTVDGHWRRERDRLLSTYLALPVRRLPRPAPRRRPVPCPPRPSSPRGKAPCPSRTICPSTPRASGSTTRWTAPIRACPAARSRRRPWRPCPAIPCASRPPPRPREAARAFAGGCGAPSKRALEAAPEAPRHP
ncbi:MAG: hypothetical protein R3F43_19400 [bacterium]